MLKAAGVRDATLLSMGRTAAALLLAKALSFFAGLLQNGGLLYPTPKSAGLLRSLPRVGKAILRWRPLRDCDSHSLKTLQGLGLRFQVALLVRGGGVQSRMLIAKTCCGPQQLNPKTLPCNQYIW